MASGAFITVEGSDGAGKTTQMQLMRQYLIDCGKSVVMTREPGGTKLGEELRRILLDNHDLSLSDEAELMLMFTARTQHLTEIIAPALAIGKWVLCDRFTDATYAYQGGGRGIGENRIQALETWVQQGLNPDLTLVLDVPIEIGLERVKSRRTLDDRFERQQLEFKQAVRQVYLDRAKQFPQRMKVIDGSRSIAEVQRVLIGHLAILISDHS